MNEAETTVEIDEIKRLQREIVKCLEIGEDPADLQNQLADVRRKVAAQIELRELRREADHRAGLRQKAAAVTEKANLQGARIDALLQSCSQVVTKLQPLIEEAALLKAAQDECHEFDQLRMPEPMKHRIPVEYLPPGLKLPVLELGDGTSGRDVHLTTSAAHAYLQFALGLLANLRREDRELFTRPAEGLESDGDHP